MSAEDWASVAFIYGIASLVIGGCAVIVWSSPMTDEQRRVSARLALTCWAWPLWAVVGALLLLIGLIEDAL